MIADPQSQGRRVLARVERRFLPLAFLCYVVAYIDRVNVGFVANVLQRDLGLSATQFGLAAGLFFIGYCLFEIPSNLILERVGARVWIARIMIGWGLVSMATMFVRGPGSFMAARVVLGIAEAGFFPGIVLFFTYWFPASERARTGALFMMASPISVIVGAPISTYLLTLDGALGLRGWQWLFLIEGVPAVIVGIIVLVAFTDRPEHARWLDDDERAWLARTMADERARRQAVGATSIRASLRNRQLWLLCAVFFLNSIANYGMFLWLPKLIEDVTGAEGWRLAVMTAVPFAVALGAMVVVGRASDRSGHRTRYVAGCAAMTAAGLVVAVIFQRSDALLLVGLTIAQMAIRSLAGVFWAIPPQLLGGAAAAAGIGLINATGNIGGFVGPSLIGILHDATGSYSGSLIALTGVLLLEALLILCVRVPRLDPPLEARS
jgi:MFS family permease